MSPEARPASCSPTPASPAIETGMKANAVPIPTMMNGPARLAQKCPCTGTWVDHKMPPPIIARSEEHTSELQSHVNLVCRLLLEKKKKTDTYDVTGYSSLTNPHADCSLLHLSYSSILLHSPLLSTTYCSHLFFPPLP